MSTIRLKNNGLLTWLGLFDPNDGMISTETTYRSESYRDTFDGAHALDMQTTQSLPEFYSEAVKRPPTISIPITTPEVQYYNDEIKKRPPSFFPPLPFPPRWTPSVIDNDKPKREPDPQRISSGGDHENGPKPPPGGVLMTTTINNGKATTRRTPVNFLARMVTSETNHTSARLAFFKRRLRQSRSTGNSPTADISGSHMPFPRFATAHRLLADTETKTYVAFSMKAAQAKVEQAIKLGEDFRTTQLLLYDLGGITKPLAIVLDTADSDWIVVGERDASSAPLTLDDLSVALRARFQYPPDIDPGVTIDPQPLDPTAGPHGAIDWTADQKVHFFAGIENTHFGPRLLRFRLVDETNRHGDR